LCDPVGQVTSDLVTPSVFTMYAPIHWRSGDKLTTGFRMIPLVRSRKPRQMTLSHRMIHLSISVIFRLLKRPVMVK
jgi:hypothetical protein